MILKRIKASSGGSLLSMSVWESSHLSLRFRTLANLHNIVCFKRNRTNKYIFRFKNSIGWLKKNTSRKVLYYYCFIK